MLAEEILMLHNIFVPSKIQLKYVQMLLEENR